MKERGRDGESDPPPSSPEFGIRRDTFFEVFFDSLPPKTLTKMTTRLSDEKSPSIEKDSPVLSTKDLEASEPIVRYANPLDDPQFASIDEKKLLRRRRHD